MKKYRLKDEKYRKLAQEIAGFNKGGITPLEHYVSIEGSLMRSKLEEYGVFDLWFEEVQEPFYKPGDYIYAIKTGNVYKIENCEIIEDELHWNSPGVSRYEYAYSAYLFDLRLATAEEIKEHSRQLPYIDGYKGKQEGDYIVYGCKSIHIQDFRRLYEACLYTDLTVNSITIEGYQVQKKTLQEIYEKTYYD